MRGLSVRKLFEEQKDIFHFECLTDNLSSERLITVSDVHRPGLALAGFTRNFLFERIQILGETEMLFLETLSDEERVASIDRLFEQTVPCVIVAKGLEYDGYLRKRASEEGIPVLRTPQSTTPFIHQLTEYLANAFAPQTTVHGSLVDVYGVGLLITGRSGIGKSECALDLVERGHRLVSDDMVVVTRRHNLLYGEARDHLRYHMEIRGIGIIDVRRMFGVRAISKDKRIDVEVRLREWSVDVEYDRLGLEERMTTILGKKMPVVTIPLIPGKNITVLAEVVAMNHQLRIHGIRTAEELGSNLAKAMGGGGETARS